MTVETHRIDVVENTVQGLIAVVAQKTLDGYEIDPAMPGDTNYFGNLFSVSMIRTQKSVDNMKVLLAAIGEKPRMNRVEAAAAAREAKRVKPAILDVNTVQAG